METKRYDEMSEKELDIIREAASIGTGYAATSLAGLIGEQVRMTIPEINILDFDKTVEKLGDPEEGIAAVLMRISGEMEGMMLFLLRLDFINAVIGKMMGHTIQDYEELSELETSAVTEIGNIIISSYTNALSMLSGMKIELSVPSVSVNMLGGILSVPMAEFGYVTDKLMMIDGQLKINEQKLNSTLLMLPDADSLDRLMKELGAVYENGN
ncbi:chemotaxis protein CheC [Mediterraneibacter sp. NSJ-55]|uniref:Chemotaxis protein CheC n=1 Tax=Mediterraneibacter hominis TaxID=2763054 RepID=A0A923RR61_9FIRM|nr:chemotaxis protein CheC [Mediterraneibacter hominis]MBC5689358.1 chemotaxis protein CheC [Mediterraneibacter hominis]